jgi:hypothetical protein|tara:strand:+ start:410 stop:541 length:132 start_codon:yes stop_codon:yes gene_type:complete
MIDFTELGMAALTDSPYMSVLWAAVVASCLTVLGLLIMVFMDK